MLRRSLLLSVVLVGALAWGGAQAPAPTAEGKPGTPPPKNPPPPRSEPAEDPNESSSRDTLIELRDPDAAPPRSEGEEAADSDVQEMRSYDPHRAEHNVEVGDYLMKRKSYRAAESRYREALEYKPNDAIATFRLAAVLEKMGELEEARQRYQEYLKILPHGPLAADAKKALERLKSKKETPKQASRATSPPAENHP